MYAIRSYYVDSFCINSPKFGEIRSRKKEQIRFGDSEEKIIAAAVQLRDSGVHLIELSTGETQNMFHSDFGLKRLLCLIERIRSVTGLPLMLSSEAVSEKIMPQIAASRTEWYSSCQETAHSESFEVMCQERSYVITSYSIHYTKLYEEPLVQHFLSRLNSSFGTYVKGLSDEVMELFKSYSWPGNIREMEHLLEGAMNSYNFV